MDERKLFGNQGEDSAAKFLTTLGLEVIARQWRCVLGEVDLICLDSSGEVVFVEVKTRQSLESGYPEDSVTPQKLRHLQACAECFLQERQWEERPYRFDVVAIILDDFGQPEITHLVGI